jgi:ferredoxin
MIDRMTAGLGVPAASHAVAGSGVVKPDESALLRSRGFSSPSEACEPKIIALRAVQALPAAEPVANVSYVSRGNVLVVAGTASARRARDAAAILSARLPVTLIDPAAGTPGPANTWSGRIEKVSGYLGDFTVTIAALRTAPAAAAAAKPVDARFDLILDFGDEPLFAMRQPPQGYWRPDADGTAVALEEMAAAVGEFEKPRFFNYRENICAHSRSQVVGCDACIEICSTSAISSEGDRVKVDPHLCMGCGACATVCPSGAMSFQYPRVADRGVELKQLLTAFRGAGGSDACIVIHNSTARELLAEAALAGQGLPARALPVESWHVASTGLDLLLPAIAFGASQVAVIAAAGEDREYIEALRHQMSIGQAILTALGYAGTHFAVIEASSPGELVSGIAALAPAGGVESPATFHVGNDKRTAIEFAVEHLARHAPRKAEAIPLPAGAPFGEIRVDAAKCTMCMACVGACPESALMDGVDKPLLRFLERNCVQCGLCENTCPEEAISLSPRLLLTPAVRETRTLNETQPFHCIRCSKPFGTKQMVDAMMGRLAAHSMFTQGSALQRLQMCADCRVVDMMASKSEMSILKLGADS